MSLSPGIRNTLISVQQQHEEIAGLLSEPDVVSDRNRFATLSKEYSDTEVVVKTFTALSEAERQIEECEVMLTDDDPEIRELAAADLTSLRAEIETLEKSLRVLLLPKDPNDSANVFLEIRAGTGGNEAALFSGDLLRMYTRYAETKGWRLEMLSSSAGEVGGYREIICRVEGEDVYALLKFESGTHRVQRVPETESQGRRHTSTCTVAVLPEPEDVQDIEEIDKTELRIDTYRASGAGGQHVNKTDSAVRLTHLPTGIVVECQDERSQHKNRARAMSLLKAKINEQQRIEREAEAAAERKSLVGTGERSEKIRTYNFPENRATDHRINLVLYKLPEVIQGDLDDLILPLIQEQQAIQLAELGQ